MSEVTKYDDGDGFGKSLASGGRLIKGLLLKWNETKGWFDRDGLRPPEPLLAYSITEALQRWKDNKVIDEKREHPLPDVDELNAEIPVAEWGPGLNGQPKPPWSHQKIIYFLDPGAGQIYTYMNDTVGARIMWETLNERVTVIRLIRNDPSLRPLVTLSHVPMKTSFGMKHRPHLDIVDWTRPPGSGGGVINGPPTPQLPGPGSQSPPSSPAAAAGLESVPPLSVGEEIDDQIPWA